jgi:hypothetical protein
MSDKRLGRVAVAQGLYYTITGVWPLVSLRTFEAITGPKTDKWLVRTVGILVATIGTGLTWSGIGRCIHPALETMGVGSALGLGAIDVVYASRGVISRIYLLDALIEYALVAGWLWSRSGESATHAREQSPTKRARCRHRGLRPAADRVLTTIANWRALAFTR